MLRGILCRFLNLHFGTVLSLIPPKQKSYDSGRILEHMDSFNVFRDGKIIHGSYSAKYLDITLQSNLS